MRALTIMMAAVLGLTAAELALGPVVMLVTGCLAMGYLTMEAIGEKR